MGYEDGVLIQNADHNHFGGLVPQGNSPNRLGKRMRKLYLKIICLFTHHYDIQGIFGWQLRLERRRPKQGFSDKLALSLKTRGGLDSMSFDTFITRQKRARTHSLHIGAAALAQSLIFLLNKSIVPSVFSTSVDDKARYSAFKVTKVKTDEPKALVLVDSMVNWSDHAAENKTGKVEKNAVKKLESQEKSSDKSSDSQTYASYDSSLKTKTKDFPPAVDIKTLPESDVEDPNSTAGSPSFSCLENKIPSVNSAGRRKNNPAGWTEKTITCFLLAQDPELAWVTQGDPSNNNDIVQRKATQNKASYKHISAVRLISETLQLLHMDLFGPTNIRSIDQKYYSLVVTDDFKQCYGTANAEYAEELAKLQRQEYEAKDVAARYGYLFSQETAEILSQAEAEIRNQGVFADRDPAGIASAGSDPASGNPAGSDEPAGKGNPAVSTSVSTDFISVHADESTLPPGQPLGSSANTT
ncbi:hypothetical protein Tco_0930774 [Tanacetum coccineum]